MIPFIGKIENHVKGWGAERWLVNNDKYCGKILEFNKGGQTSLHVHFLKSETYYILDGYFVIEYIDTNNGITNTFELKQGEVLNVPRYTHHRIIAPNGGKLLEISTQHFEHDSYRILPGDSQKTS